MGDLVENVSGAFDPVFDALKQTIGLYSQIESIKLNNQLARARYSAENVNNPTPTQDAQAKAQSLAPMIQNNIWIVGAAVLVGAAALYVIVK